jgi:SpoVK/Ycf46/Vps4 family AAA+-type ATPase
LVREAQLNALKTSLFETKSSAVADVEIQLFITMRDFTVALQKVFPSVSKKDELAYKHLENSLRKSRSHITDGKSTTQ